MHRGLVGRTVRRNIPEHWNGAGGIRDPGRHIRGKMARKELQNTGLAHARRRIQDRNRFTTSEDISDDLRAIDQAIHKHVLTKPPEPVFRACVSACCQSGRGGIVAQMEKAHGLSG